MYLEVHFRTAPFNLPERGIFETVDGDDSGIVILWNGEKIFLPYSNILATRQSN